MDIYQKLENKAYENDYPYPSRLSRNCLKCNTLFSTEDNFCKNCGHNVKDYYEEGKRRYNQELTNHRKREQELCNQFKQDCFEFYKIVDNPKADKAFSLARDERNSNGYGEVFDFLGDIVDLIK
jgi:predicted amidophosphoribosyltransferase